MPSERENERECFDCVLVTVDEETIDQIKRDNERLKAEMFDLKHDVAALKELLSFVLESKLAPAKN